MEIKMERLDKFISNQAQISRSQVRILVKKKLVTVNDKVETNFDTKINPDEDIIKLNGEEISFRKNIYIMLNKPQGFVCSTKDGLSPTVLTLVPEHLLRKGLFPAGRLDKDTEGFVLLTDDGDLSHKMLSPKNHVPKIYYCELEKDVEENYIEKFKSGMKLLTGEKCLPADIVFSEKPNVAFVVLNEGMFHQVKRMFEVVGNKITFLKRVQIGGLPLAEDLALGECREIMHKDVSKLLEHFVTKNIPFEKLVKYSSK